MAALHARQGITSAGRGRRSVDYTFTMLFLVALAATMLARRKIDASRARDLLTTASRL